MAINPIRVNPLDYPANPTQIPTGTGLAAGIANLGAQIGAYRDQQEEAALLREAIDPQTGAFDVNRAVRAYANAGRDPTGLIATAMRQQTLTEQARHNKAIEESQRITAEAAKAASQTRGLHFDPGGYGPGGYRPPSFYLPPDATGAGAKAFPVPSGPTATPPPPPPAPAPQSALPGPSFAAVEPNPEEAAPYRVAGPPVPPPTQVAQAAPATAPAPKKPQTQDEWITQNFPDDAEMIRGLRDNKRDPYKAGVSQEHRQFLFNLVGRLKPGWSPDDFALQEKQRVEQEKRDNPTVSPEMRARIAMTKSYLDSLEDRTEGNATIPGIKSRVAGGELQGQGRIAANFGQGTPGELRAAIDEGAESLIRMLTGAGMNKEEASDYARRFRWNPIDDLVGTGTMRRKVDSLEKVLRYVTKEVEGGSRGDAFLKDFKSQFGQDVAVKHVTSDAETDKRIRQGREAIAANPANRDQVLRMWRQMNIPNAERYLP